MSEYEVQANEFLAKAGAKMTISRTGEVEGFLFDDHDRLWHDRYQVTLTRSGRQYRFTFYGSFADWKNNKRPSRYSVLACLQKYPVPDTVEEFAQEFGFDLDSPKQMKFVEKVRKACKKQYEKLFWLFGDELVEDLREIC